jgi:hypothetical protein
MALPPEVEEAKARMDKADAALRADIESNAPVNRARRLELIDELQMAADDYNRKDKPPPWLGLARQIS